jgi:hypothetical protein
VILFSLSAALIYLSAAVVHRFVRLLLVPRRDMQDAVSSRLGGDGIIKVKVPLPSLSPTGFL